MARRASSSGPATCNLSSRAWTNYLSSLDPDRSFFLASDIEGFRSQEASLGDSLSMIAGQQISSHAEVIVEARISRSGNAVAKDGDLQSKPQTVRVGEKKLKLVVDHAFSSAK